MKTLDKGQDKIKQICDVLKHETLEPAKLEGEAIIKAAKEQAEQIISEARLQAKKILEEGRHAIEQERNVFHSSLAQSSKQSIEAMKQAIEQKLFNRNLEELITQETSATPVVAKLIEAIITGIDKEGVSQDFAVLIPKCCSPDEIARSLSQDVLNKLSKHPITVGDFNGGAQVKLMDKKLTLVITDREICEFLKHYVRKDFRKFIFSGSHESQG